LKNAFLAGKDRLSPSELKAVGVPEEQAKVQANAMREVIEDIGDQSGACKSVERMGIPADHPLWGHDGRINCHCGGLGQIDLNGLRNPSPFLSAALRSRFFMHVELPPVDLIDTKQPFVAYPHGDGKI
jgi:hypothetical protein